MSQDIAKFLAAQQVDSLEQMKAVITDPEKMLTIAGIGEKTIQTLQTFFTNPQTRDALKQLEARGIQFTALSSTRKKT
jgi:NAD-dependent DNA ligase